MLFIILAKGKFWASPEIRISYHRAHTVILACLKWFWMAQVQYSSTRPLLFTNSNLVFSGDSRNPRNTYFSVSHISGQYIGITEEPSVSAQFGQRNFSRVSKTRGSFFLAQLCSCRASALCHGRNNSYFDSLSCTKHAPLRLQKQTFGA